MSARTGQCMCGAVRFEAARVPDHFGVCHCEMCRRWTGSALFGVTIQADDLVVHGQENIERVQSSQWAERAWCRRCGSGLWYRVTSHDAPGHGAYEVPIGLFDRAHGIRLSREIFIDGKPDGYAIEGDHQRLTRAETLALYGVEL